MKCPTWILVVTLLGPVPSGQSQTPDSPAKLMRDVLAATQAKDVAGLNALTITEAEFKQFVWPQLTLLRQTGGETDPNKFYAEYRTQSEAGAAELVREFGGGKLQYKQAAVFRQAPNKSMPPKSFELLDGPNVFVVDEYGNEQMIRLTGGILKTGGIWKVTTYHLRPEQRIQSHGLPH